MSIYEIQLGSYPTPLNISYAWSYGSVSGLTMALQVATGIVIDSGYIASESLVANILESINRDGLFAWLTRFTHSNMPAILFIALYCHQARSLLIGSRAVWAWLTGWIIILLTIIVAFLGYSCVWSLMSYWAATVITSLVTVVPAGSDALDLLWGSPTISQSTLTRFMAFHYALALITIALAAAHIVAVHYLGSSNPIVTQALDKLPFMEYFTTKDAIALLVAILISTLLIFVAPTSTMDTELYLLVNTMSTPEHIVPEFYLLAYYAVLRCVPSKALGCIAALGLLLLLLTTSIKQD